MGDARWLWILLFPLVALVIAAVIVLWTISGRKRPDDDRKA